MADSLNKKKNGSSAGETTPAPETSVSISDIEKLFSLMRENEIAELEIEQHKTKIHIVSKGAPATAQPVVQYVSSGMQPMQMLPQQPGQEIAQPATVPAPQPASKSTPAASPDSDDTESAESSLPPNAKTILSPMVGTFYQSPSPDSPPFVQEGDVVNEETVLCIIEAMKLMNEIKAETRGKIVRVLVENGMPVEFNQPLFAIVP